MIRRTSSKPLVIVVAFFIAIIEILACNAMFQRGYREGQLDAQAGRYHWIILNDKVLETQGELP